MILVSNRLTIGNKVSYESREWTAQNVGRSARNVCEEQVRGPKALKFPSTNETRKKGSSSTTNCSLFYNFSQHPSISSASLQAFCYTGGSDEYHLNDQREILRIASQYPDNFRDTVQDLEFSWETQTSAKLNLQIRWLGPAYYILDFSLQREREKWPICSLPQKLRFG